MALILCTGLDPETMQQRRQTLERAGHTIITATNEKELASACKTHNFDIVILGQTLGPNMKQHVADLVKQYCPKSKVLELYSPSAGPAVPYVDSWISVPSDSPQDLPEQVTKLTKAA